MESKEHKELKERAIKYLFDKSCWIVRPEVDCGYYGRYDVWGIKRDENLLTYGIEVKISKEDFRNNKRKEAILDLGIDKQKEWWIPANLNYILCPEGLLQPDEIHRRYGLLWFNGERLVNKKWPLFNEMTDRQKLEIVMLFLASRQNKNPISPTEKAD